jgi:hypothetical protein
MLASRHVWRFLILAFIGTYLFGQAPTGTIVGTVKDETGAVVPGASVTITSRSTNAPRTVTTNAEGLYGAPSLQPDSYEVRVEMKGFRTEVREVAVTAGTTFTADASLKLGDSAETVTVEASAAQLNYESHTVEGVVERNTIQELPLNGRNFLQLASLEPGVTIGAGAAAQFNSLQTVTVLGQVGALFTIDGGDINDHRLQQGYLSMNYSQEVVQEFQMSSVNFDNATGITAAGAINIVTRSGGNDFHGSAYFYYRDHNMAAYPGLSRSLIDPHPFFQRKNPGFLLSGPIMKNKAFFFFNYEHMNQTLVYAEQQDLPSLQPLNGNFPSPYTSNLVTARFDYLLSPRNVMFARYSHDGNYALGPYAGSQPIPSSWSTNSNWSDQAVVGLTTTISASMVNDLRTIFHFWQDNANQPGAENCQLPCIGVGLPSITSMVGSSSFYGGVNDNSPNNLQERAFQVVDNLSIQKGSHRIRFGIDEEVVDTNVNVRQTCIDSCLSLYSPETTSSLVSAAAGGAANLATYFPNLPSHIATNNDLLNLPVSLPTAALYGGVPIGNSTFPGYYERGASRYNWRTHPWVADSWKVRPNLTLNAGLGYILETNLWYNNLPYPQFLAPIIGQAAVGKPASPRYLDFSPTVGFAWSPFKDNKTVIRGGAGIYWATQSNYQEYQEAFTLGPPGDGFTHLSASIFTNPYPGIFDFSTNKAVPVGASLPLQQLTNLTLAQYIQISNTQLPNIAQIFPARPAVTSGPYPVSGIDLSKSSTESYLPSTPLPRSYQTSIGVQRNLGKDIVIATDFVRRQVENVLIGEVDLNRFARYINGVSTPVIPQCTAAQGLSFTPGLECSTGAITFWPDWGRTVYDGLLTKLQKRMSNHYQFTASYAFQKSLNISPIDLDNLRAGYGQNLAHHNLNISAVGELPWGIKVSLNSSMISRAPFNPIVSGVDLNGSGNTSYPITEAVSGMQNACFAVGCSQSQLASAIQTWNSTLAGTKDARGTVLPKLILPPNYSFGSPVITQDIRVTKEFTARERYKLSTFVEVFNALNIANLSGYSSALNTLSANPATQAYTFGQPTSRVLQTFGSGGPRALQVGARLSF